MVWPMRAMCLKSAALTWSASTPTYSAEDLKEEIEARDSKLAILSDAAKKREDELRMELARQSTHFGERISRLERELQDQLMQAAECIRELKAKSNTSRSRALKPNVKIIVSKRAFPGGLPGL